MKSKKIGTKSAPVVKNEADIQAEKVLAKIVAEDPKLRMLLKKSAPNGDLGIGDDIAQLYRQRLTQ